MTRILICCSAALICLVMANMASAQQMIPPGWSQFNPPPPAPPPPPKIEVPVVPRFDAPVTRDYRPEPRPSFHDRMSRCLDEAAAAGLRPGKREAYARGCANR